MPGRPAGTGTMLWATIETCSSPVIVSNVISDSYTPGAIELTRTGMRLRANSVANILVRWVAAAFELLYANYSSKLSDRQSTRFTDGCAHVSLRDLQKSTYAGDVDDAGRVSFDISTALVK